MAPHPTSLSHLEFHVLLALARGALYGYAICQAVESESGGAVAPNAGSLYRVIARLLGHGLVEEAPDPAGEAVPHPGRTRRYYALTPEGSNVMRAEVARLRRTTELAERRMGLADRAGR